VSPEFIFRCGNIDALRDILAGVASGRVNLRDIGRRAASRVRSWSPRENIEATVEAIERAIARVHSSLRKSPDTLSSKSNA